MIIILMTIFPCTILYIYIRWQYIQVLGKSVCVLGVGWGFQVTVKSCELKCGALPTCRKFSPLHEVGGEWNLTPRTRPLDLFLLYQI